jgi:hypothetical protein
MNTLSATPRPWYRWKAEDLSFLHVLLVWGVTVTSLLIKKRQSWAFVLRYYFWGNRQKIDKEIMWMPMALWTRGCTIICYMLHIITPLGFCNLVTTPTRPFAGILSRNFTFIFHTHLWAILHTSNVRHACAMCSCSCSCIYGLLACVVASILPLGQYTCIVRAAKC